MTTNEATRTYKAKASGEPYEMTVTAVTTPAGTPGVLLTCSCATHREDARSAIFPSDRGTAFPRNLIHGHVTMASSIAGEMLRRQGRMWKA